MSSGRTQLNEAQTVLFPCLNSYDRLFLNCAEKEIKVFTADAPVTKSPGSYQMPPRMHGV